MKYDVYTLTHVYNILMYARTHTLTHSHTHSLTDRFARQHDAPGTSRRRALMILLASSSFCRPSAHPTLQFRTLFRTLFRRHIRSIYKSNQTLTMVGKWGGGGGGGVTLRLLTTHLLSWTRVLPAHILKSYPLQAFLYGRCNRALTKQFFLSRSPVHVYSHGCVWEERKRKRFKQHKRKRRPWPPPPLPQH